MEQRNGRIDRKLQPMDEVFCHYFVYKQRPEDRILRVLVRKTETIKQELGTLSQVIDARLAKSMQQGIRHRHIDRLESEIESVNLDAEHRQTIEEELEAARERQDQLRSQIDRLRILLEDSQKSIGLSEDHFRSAISCALSLVGAEGLTPLAPEEQPDGPERYRFPALDQREGADPTWADTLDTLRTLRQKDQKPWEWRRESPIRPVVFEDPGTMDEDVVHLHLEHRVVQRLLGRFTAQGFVHHDLSRACLAQTTDTIPRVILLGRLALYGPGAARLHEELVPVAARWTDLNVRKEPLKPYARDAETKTLSLLDQAFISSSGHIVSDTVRKLLQESATRDVQELLLHLQTRGEEYAVDAERKLLARSEAEAKAMREILETQKKHIAATVAKHSKDDPNQLRFQFANQEELRQLEANKRYWTKRLAMIDEELETEPARIREIYQVKAKRIEPVGLVYLWPVTG
jgi:septum formation topological specificity factor MinE